METLKLLRDLILIFYAGIGIVGWIFIIIVCAKENRDKKRTKYRKDIEEILEQTK